MLMVALTFWMIVAASSLFLSDRWLQFRLQQLWSATGLSVVLLWILFTTRYTHRSVRTNQVVRVFGGAYVLLLITALTIPFHDLYYASLTVQQSPFPHVATTPGRMRILSIGYVAAGIIIGTYYLGSLFQDTRRQLGTPTIILAISVLLGFIPFVASELNYAPVSTYNHTAFGVSVFILGVSYSVYRHSFYDLAPIGRATLIEVIDDPMVVLDTEFRLVDYNPAATRILSDLTEESIGTPLREVHPKLATLVTDSDGAEETEITLPVTGKNRTFSVLISDITAAPDSEGYVLFLRDITTLRNRERELQRQNERLNQFASTVSHDLRNPLNVAEGRLELAQKDSESEHLAPIENAHERMETLIDDLLTLARVGQTVEDTDLVALGDVASDAWDHTDMDTCTFNSSIPPETQIEADRNRLLHVFENLYRNAADHNDPPLTVRVGMITDSDSVTDNDQRTGFFVEDNGSGIPEEHRENILDHGFTTVANGTGLGLSIVNDIVEAHGWNMHVVDGTDGGARFNITGIDIDQ
jgi:PAS domain S-box-containing protein